MNLGDPELELIDPTPNIHMLFIQFDRMFFYTALASRAVVRWSKRMYSCAGICSYEGRGGLCDIALSEPLLKLRPRKDLVETLLHEMIHAYLFVTCRDQDRDGHGPNFKAHMHRINHSAGLNISIYHDFHDEVKLYQTHVWRCNGPCQKFRPHFGIVRRTVNRPPSQKDFWWEAHRWKCGGTFIKIQEPEKPEKPVKPTKKIAKPNADITKYITTQKTVNNNNSINKPILKDSNSVPVKTKSNGGSTLVITKKVPVLNPQVAKPPVLFSGKGESLTSNRPRSSSVGVVETVRNIWSNKQLPSSPILALNNNKNMSPLENVRNIWANKKLPSVPTASVNKQTLPKGTNSKAFNVPVSNKHKLNSPKNSPPTKIKKIDDYFKTTATNMLKDVYGKDFQISNNENKDNKLVASIITSEGKVTDVKPATLNNCDVWSTASSSRDLVSCPICSIKVDSRDINRHLDECLNKEVIEKISKESNNNKHEEFKNIPQNSQNQNVDKKTLKNLIGPVQQIPAFKPKTGKTEEDENRINEKIEKIFTTNLPVRKSVIKAEENFNNAVLNLKKEIKHVTNIVQVGDNLINNIKTNTDKHLEKPNNLISIKEDDNFDLGFLPYFDEVDNEKSPVIKVEPGTSKNEDITESFKQNCACCGKLIDKPLEVHLDECLAFFTNNNSTPVEGASTSVKDTIVIDDDEEDQFDDSQIFNATGTKTPCPCCLQMVEEMEMNDHLDHCLAS